MSAYTKKLQDERWLKRRAIILERDQHTCQHPKCLSNLNLQVHHRDYIPGIDPWDYPDDMLITLCAVHHEKENYRKKIRDQLDTSLKMNGFLLSDVMALATKVHYDPVFTKTLLRTLRENG